MAASLHLTSTTVAPVTVSLDDLVSFAADVDRPGVTRVFTTGGMVRVLENVDTILRLLASRPHAAA